MRIRKHAKLSSLLFSLPSPPPPPPTHLCQLNQSPWDVIPFSSFPYQLHGEEDLFFSGNGNGIAHDPAGAAAQSMASDISRPKQVSGFDFSSNEQDLIYNGDDNGNSDSDGAEVGDWSSWWSVKGIICKKTNGKSWRCSRAAREGHYYCDYHSKPRRHTADKDGPPVTEKIKKRRGRPPKKAKAGTGTQPMAMATKSNQFYYYSGFGPLWGNKRRNERGAGGWESLLPVEIEGGSSPPTPSSSLQIEMEMDDEDEEVSSGDSGGGKKRVRKPVKARSLKSLM